MKVQVVKRRPGALLRIALLLGMGSGLVLALTDLIIISVSGSMSEGATFVRAVTSISATDEDWEMIPAYLIGALLLGATVALAAAGVWLLLSSRLAHSFWVPWLGATIVATVIPFGILLGGIPGVRTAIPAALITFIATPIVAYDRRAPLKSLARIVRRSVVNHYGGVRGR